MRKFIIPVVALLLFIAPAAYGQTFVGIPQLTAQAGAPTYTACAGYQVYVDTTAGNWYVCKGGVLTLSGGSGSGTVNSGTGTQIAYYATTGTAVSGDAALTDASNTLAYTGSGGITASAGPLTSGLPAGGVGSSIFLEQEGTIPTGLSASGQDNCYADSTQHGLLCNFNAGTTLALVQGPASSTANYLAIWNATNGGLLKSVQTLPTANGGTNCTSATITCFNNITGFSAAGTTGTTSTNLVFSTSPTFVTPVLGVATGTSLAATGFLSSGTAPATTCGTGGCFSATEGTIATGLSTADTISADSTHHCWDNSVNNVDLGCLPGVTAGGLTSTALVTAGASSFNLQTPSATSTLSSGGALVLAGSASVTGTVQAAATNTALTVQAGQDATTQASTAAITVRGEDVTGGSTASLTGGATTVRGGNNASTGASGAAGALTIQAGGMTGAATNLSGADTVVASGLGTGNAQASHTILKHPTFSQTSGTTAQTAVAGYIRLAKAGSTTSAQATTMFSVAAAAGNSAGGMVIVHVYTTQATPHSCSDTGIWEFAVQGDTSPTANINRVDATPTTICDTGTLTLTAAMSAANPSVFSVTPTWTTIVPTAVWIEIIIINPSDVDITTISD